MLRAVTTGKEITSAINTRALRSKKSVICCIGTRRRSISVTIYPVGHIITRLMIGKALDRVHGDIHGFSRTDKRPSQIMEGKSHP